MSRNNNLLSFEDLSRAVLIALIKKRLRAPDQNPSINPDILKPLLNDKFGEALTELAGNCVLFNNPEWIKSFPQSNNSGSGMYNPGPIINFANFAILGTKNPDAMASDELATAARTLIEQAESVAVTDNPEQIASAKEAVLRNARADVVGKAVEIFGSERGLEDGIKEVDARLAQLRAQRDLEADLPTDTEYLEILPDEEEQKSKLASILGGGPKLPGERRDPNVGRER